MGIQKGGIECTCAQCHYLTTPSNRLTQGAPASEYDAGKCLVWILRTLVEMFIWWSLAMRSQSRDCGLHTMATKSPTLFGSKNHLPWQDAGMLSAHETDVCCYGHSTAQHITRRTQDQGSGLACLQKVSRKDSTCSMSRMSYLSKGRYAGAASAVSHSHAHHAVAAQFPGCLISRAVWLPDKLCSLIPAHTWYGMLKASFMP